ncbi:putative serine threonine kinase [Rosellinia necatrix]|uniref:Putative serine threonine kinase n=1 Tax=Rosellinia necatrix TaxID=77044 RepID=A0A1S8A5V1_ROSNE|nr:putative serine threonine kinase [Rosellinia necatrix]
MAAVIIYEVVHMQQGNLSFDDLVFDHTKIIVRRKVDNQYFHGGAKERVSSTTIDIDKAKLVEIQSSDLWPIFDPNYAIEKDYNGKRKGDLYPTEPPMLSILKQVAHLNTANMNDQLSSRGLAFKRGHRSSLEFSGLLWMLKGEELTSDTC